MSFVSVCKAKKPKKILYISELYVTYLDKTNEQWNHKQQQTWRIPQNSILQLLKGLNIFLVKKETIRTVLIATHLLTNNSRNNLELSLLCRNFIASIIPTIAEKVIQLMHPKIEQLVQEAIQPHIPPLLDK